MKKFEESLFKTLSSQSGFYIKDYYSNVNNSNKWIAILEKEDFIYAVVIEAEKNANTTFLEARQYILQNYSKKAGLNVVITTENSSYDMSKFDNYSKVIYSLKDNKVVYSHEGCKPLVSSIEYMKRKEITRKNRFKDNSVTYTLIAINVIIFFISILISKSIYDIDIYTLAFMGAKVNSLINEGQVWRLLTCAFLHGGLMHIAFNMYALKAIGSEVEYAYGKRKYIIIYLLSALGGGAFSYLFNPNSISVGASGAIFGLFGAMLAFGFKHRNRIGKEYMISLFKVIIVNVVIGVTISNIDNSAHLGGLILGILSGGIFLLKDLNTKLY